MQKRFGKNPKIVDLRQLNISNELHKLNKKYQFITAIRTIKYNKNWKSILNGLNTKLAPGGIIVFDMLNKNSLNFFSRYDIPLYRTTKKELKDTLGKANFDLLEIKSLSRIPDYFYEISNNALASRVLFTVERLLTLVFGKTMFGRILYVAAKESPKMRINKNFKINSLKYWDRI